jgi:hypothetical protein
VVVGLPGAMLVAAPPAGPVQDVCPVAAGRRDDGAAQQSQQLGRGDRDHPGGGAGVVVCAFEGDGDGEVDVGEQADRCPAVPGGPAGDLALVQAAGLLGLLVVFLAFPAGDRDGDEPLQRDGLRGPASLAD